jgi:NitT/TauT family transport system permease protein
MSATDARERPGTAAPAEAAAPSEAYLAFLRGVRRRRRAVLGVQILLLIAFLILWEVAPRMEWVNAMLTSYPSAIWPTFTSMMAEGDLLYHTWVTLEETVIGFLIALILGLLVAVALWWSEFVYRVLDPYLVVGNAMPKIALVPIFYIWLGEKASIYGIAVAIGVFITILMIFNGFQEIDPNKIKLVRTFGGTRWQILRKVILPGSVPTIVAALKINIGLALVGVIVGEFQSAKAGLGYLIVYGSQVFQMHLVMTAIAVLVVISTIMYVAILLFERRVLRYR